MNCPNCDNNGRQYDDKVFMDYSKYDSAPYEYDTIKCQKCKTVFTINKRGDK